MDYGEKNIYFFKNSSSPKSVEQFIQKIIEERNKYLEEKYKDHTYFQDTECSSVSTEIYKLSKLREQNIISEEAFIQMKKINGRHW